MHRVALIRGLIVVSLFAMPQITWGQIPIPHQDITYIYPLDIGPTGPNQGDSAQPRSDIGYDDDDGDQLADGITQTVYPYGDETKDASVGFNEYHGSFAGTDTGDPQPQIVFNLGGERKITGVEINYYTGGNGAIVGPTHVNFYYSYDGAQSFAGYPNSPAVTFDSFDRTSRPSSERVLYGTFTPIITLEGTNVTHIKAEFFQGNHEWRANTSAWVFLNELTFFHVPDTDGDGMYDDDDAFPDDPNEQADWDGDGLGDNEDLDDDNDGLSDVEEMAIGTNPCADDTDGDGVLDGNDVFPLDKCASNLLEFVDCLCWYVLDESVLADSDWKNRNMRKPFCNKIAAVRELIAEAEQSSDSGVASLLYLEAGMKTESDLLKKTDGFQEGGSPQGDWIVSEIGQGIVYPDLDLLREVLWDLAL